ncbi:L-ascorbate metabolism protein UlaG, beta-lactamase superfamily [Chitinophaga sp. YR573]|uniref:metal-dependent hydrolase n=1 Tax=Chitinophaga sp. YR573 TaxID=1881040 RepID=UPI0008D44B69|nr:metal-dependent hydrolase [Chitinophaga sp. YR573]SEW24496.1 L-ascorbate metabolism protein UlaG, beta-lactamase superfamily [Chitinophaga sp. YR573]
MKFTFYGHSSFAVEIKGKKIVFDPFITHNELAKSIDINKIEADYIFISHGHDDHIADLVVLARRTNATVVGSFEITTWLGKQGLERVHPMNTGGKWVFDFGTVKCVVAHHSSGLPDGSYGGNPLGFLFTTEEGNFYFAGDTALTLDMQLIPRFAKLDFAVLPIGDNFTMGAEDAIVAAEFIQCKRIIGVHYDTFGYIKIDKEKVTQQFAQAGLELLLPAIGSSIDL